MAEEFEDFSEDAVDGNDGLDAAAEEAWAELDAVLADAAEPDDVAISDLPSGDVIDTGDAEVEGAGIDYRQLYEQSLYTQQAQQQALGNLERALQILHQRYQASAADDAALAQIAQRERQQASMPNPQEDPLGWINARMTAQEELIAARFAEAEARANAASEHGQQVAVTSSIQRSRGQALADWPYYAEVEQHVLDGLAATIQVAGGNPSAAQQVMHEIYANAVRRGADPVDQIWQLAYQMGFTPPEAGQPLQQPQDPAYARRTQQARRTNAAARQPTESRSPRPTLGQQQALAMSEEDLLVFMDPASPHYDEKFMDKYLKAAGAV